jgi:phosphoribosylformylglycinamidine synthase
MVGVVPEVRHRPRGTWREGEALYLLGGVEGELGGSRFLQLVLGLEAGPVPAVDYAAESRAAAVVRGLVRQGLAAAKDLSDGGLAVAAAEMSGGTVGAELALPEGVAPARALFGEWRGGFLVAVEPENEQALVRACEGSPVNRLGAVGGSKLKIALGGRVLLDEPVEELEGLRENGLKWLSES